MIECETRIKRWGNSLGVLLPKVVVKKNKFSVEDKVKIIVTKVNKKNVAQKLWGALPQWKVSSEELERFADKELDIPV